MCSAFESRLALEMIQKFLQNEQCSFRNTNMRMRKMHRKRFRCIFRAVREAVVKSLQVKDVEEDIQTSGHRELLVSHENLSYE